MKRRISSLFTVLNQHRIAKVWAKQYVTITDLYILPYRNHWSLTIRKYGLNFQSHSRDSGLPNSQCRDPVGIGVV